MKLQIYYREGLQSSTSTCKETGSHCSILKTSKKKLNRLKNKNKKNTSWIYKKGKDSGKSPAPKIGELVK